MTAKQQYALWIALIFLIAGCFLFVINVSIAGGVMLVFAMLSAVMGMETNAQRKLTN